MFRVLAMKGTSGFDCGSPVLYSVLQPFSSKQGSYCPESIVATTDEEKASPRGSTPHSADRAVENAILEKPATIFTWQHIQYVVPVSGGERRLLNNVSGYVAPGKLTALMGESGAGKVSHPRNPPLI